MCEFFTLEMEKPSYAPKSKPSWMPSPHYGTKQKDASKPPTTKSVWHRQNNSAHSAAPNRKTAAFVTNAEPK
jgi:hypothetical protein